MPLLAEERHYTALEADGQLFQYERLPFGVTNGVSAFQRSVDKFKHCLKKVYAYLHDLTVTGETLEHDRNLKCFLDVAAECNLTINEEKSKFRVAELEKLGYVVAYKQMKPYPNVNICKLYRPTSADLCKRAEASVWSGFISCQIDT